MSQLSARKIDLTKAITAWENVKGKIPASVLQPLDPQSSATPQVLGLRQATIQSHLAQARAAQRTLLEKRQAFLDVVKDLTAKGEDSDAQEVFTHQSRVDDAIAAVEATILSLSVRLNELKTLIDSNQFMSLSDTSQNVPERSQEHQREHSSTPSTASDVVRPYVLPQRTADAPGLSSYYAQHHPVVQPDPLYPTSSAHPAVQLGKLTLEPFTGDITKFHRFWCAFELAVHNDPHTSPTFKFLYLQSLLQGEAQVVLQDLDPDECNYFELVRALKSRYDRPYKTRATLHKQLQQLPTARNTGQDLRSTWFRISGILHGLRRYEDFRTVLPLLDLVKSKFPSEVQRKLHDLEFQSNSDFDLDQVMQKLDNIIASTEKYEDSTTLSTSLSINTSLPQRSPSRSPSCSRRSSSSSRCCFCESVDHRSTRCLLDAPVAIRRTVVQLRRLCWRCLREGHSSRTCDYPACCVCGGDHHDLLCRQSSQARRHSTRDRRSDDKYHRYRSPHRYSSRSPSREHRRARSSSHSDGSRSYSRERYESSGARWSPRSSRSYSPQRVAFRSPVRDSSSHNKRRSSPYPQQNQALESEDEAEAVQSLYAGATSVNATTSSRRFASLMLVKARAFNCSSAQFEEVILFLDSGAQKSFITSSVANRLGLKVSDVQSRTFIAFGGQPTTEVSGNVQLTLIDLLDKELVVELTTKQTVTVAQFTPRLSSEDTKFIQDHGFSLPFCQSQSVVPDVLIGIDHWWDVLSPDPPVCLPSGMVLCHTRLSQSPGSVDTVAVSEHEDDVAVKRLWSLDALGIADGSDPSVDSQLQQSIVEQFNDTAIFSDGVLYVCFPWKADHPHLDDNKQLAYCRLSSQYQHLSQSPSVWQKYVQTIEDHITAGFVEDVEEYVFDDPRIYYIPHQAVFKESSSTTKLRVVFDASSKRKGAYSLNDCLHQGPSLLPDLVGILLRARLHPFLLIADVEKAFHQVRLQRSQRDATRFLWLKDPLKPPSSNNLRILRFTRIPFGVNASPFLLAAAIKLYLQREASPLGDEISRNTYVDNVILGATSREDALSKYKLVKSIFGRMHMNLREFLCNSSRVNAAISAKDRAINPSNATLLGIRWQFDRDTLGICIKTSQVQVSSKRTALRALASTYDPLGLLTPFLAPVKVFVQDLWIQELGWDTPLEKSQLEQWNQLLAGLKHPLPAIPRLVPLSNSKPGSLELCIFGDASKRLYACCAYLVCRTPAITYSNLIMAKSHLNNPKPITIPRVELLAALISVRMAQFLLNHLNLPFAAIHVFSDSLITLHWIHALKPYKVFVQNRVDAIRRIVAEIEARGIPVKFHYVASEDNPADCATRGLATKEAEHHIWWSGPHFLRSPSNQWPNANVNFHLPPPDGEDVESEHLNVQAVQQGEFVSVLPFSVTNNYLKLVRITTYVLKFLRKQVYDRVSQRMRDKIHQKLPSVGSITSSGAIQVSDIDTAEVLLILTHYRESETSLERLKLADCNAQRAQDQLIRCPSRVGPLNTAPILLVPTHRLTSIIILHYHNLFHHCGVYHTVVNLRKRFFIPFIRKIVHKTLRSCVVCKKVSGQAYRYPNVPQLPPERVKRSRPFQNIGVDYLGPLVVSNSHANSNKVWISLFTCMATRAVHLEVVLDNSAQEFLLAFRRFIARRGTPDVVYSDNSTTFHAAESAIVSVLYSPKAWESVSNYCVKHKIVWKFITPLSPWKGGFYERMVALFKTAYKKSIGRAVLQLNQLQTIAVEIEATLNSRPITPYREGDVFAYVLRPIDFISPAINIQLPPLPSHADPVYDASHNLAEWYKEMLALLDQFWEVWHSDYLSALRERQQSRVRQGKFINLTPQVGDIVIVADEKLARGQWPYGLIQKVHQGKDGCVRSADVLMASGNTKTRSVTQLYPLEIRAQSTQSTSKIVAQPPSAQRIQPSRAAKSAHKYVRSAQS